MILNLDIPYGRKLAEGQEALSNIELSAYYISIAVSQKYPDGIAVGPGRKIWGRIQTKLENAIETNNGQVEFEQGEIDFLKDAWQASKFESQIIKFVNIFEDHLFGKESTAV